MLMTLNYMLILVVGGNSGIRAGFKGPVKCFQNLRAVE